MSNTPLFYMAQWFIGLPLILQNELSAIICPLHPDRALCGATDDFAAVEALNLYLQNDRLAYSEVISRSLVMAQLIDYAMESRLKPTYWKSLEDGLASLIEKGDMVGIDEDQREELADQLELKKKVWKQAAVEWADMKGWYFSLGGILEYENKVKCRIITDMPITPYGKKKQEASCNMLKLFPEKPESFLSYMQLKSVTDAQAEIDPLMVVAAPFLNNVLQVVRPER